VGFVGTVIQKESGAGTTRDIAAGMEAPTAYRHFQGSPTRQVPIAGDDKRLLGRHENPPQCPSSLLG